MIVVYIASPYTIGDVGKNVSIHLNVANNLISHGFCVIAPLLSHFLHILYPRDWNTWLQIDMELLKRSDVLFRIEGKSKGADLEVKAFKKLGKPVVCTIDELLILTERMNDV